MSLKDDLNHTEPAKSRFEQWIDTLDAEDVDALKAAARSDLPNTHIIRAVRANGYQVGANAVATWRRTVAS